MKKNLIYIFGVIVICILCIFGIMKYEEAKSSQEKLLKSQNDVFKYYLNIRGDFSFDGNKITVNEIEYHDNRVLADVAFYNYFHVDVPVTKEQLYSEYAHFLESGEYDDGKWTEIYGKFIYDERYIEHEEYMQVIRKNLPEGVGINEATSAELENAILCALEGEK